jgi:hypothetical protein
MFWYLIKNSILSLLIVIFIHHIIIYLKNSLTTPKIIDYVNKPKKEYENIKDLLKEIKDPTEEEYAIDLDSMREELTSHIHNIQ